jgi:hypothetical protein
MKKDIVIPGEYRPVVILAFISFALGAIADIIHLLTNIPWK